VQLHEEYIAQRAKKATSENLKVSEVAFIKTLRWEEPPFKIQPPPLSTANRRREIELRLEEKNARARHVLEQQRRKTEV
jgi:hypothetical protein